MKAIPPTHVVSMMCPSRSPGRDGRRGGFLGDNEADNRKFNQQEKKV